MPTGKGLDHAARDGKAIGCTALQVFTSSPQMWKAKEVTDEKAAAFMAACAETGLDVVVSHDSYLVNLCSPNEEIRAKSIDGLSGEINRCHTYGIRWVVSHLGSHMGEGEDAGIAGVVAALKTIFDSTPEHVMVLGETTAGQGSALFYSFDHLARVQDALKRPDRFGVCLDTCHVFSAGYDIRTKETYEATFAEFDRLIGIPTLKAIHCNDSKHPLGSKKDRHEHIGEGHIGLEAFKLLVNDPRLFEVPILIETPEAPEGHARNLKVLWNLAGEPLP
jgi:deoxyribonuclease-4